MKSSQRAELAKLLTKIDNADPEAVGLLAKRPIDRLPFIIGIAGAAGVGKSLLISKLIESFDPPRNIGVLAVDPTSPASGGALLGDRVRMPRLPEGVFVRSVATRGSSGGLSDKLIDMAAAMKTFGFDDVIVETVGLGQDELAVRQVSDTLVVIEAPGLGDEVQAMKSSPLSVADIVAVNKSDKPGAAETAADIEGTTGKTPVLVSALEGTGVDDLAGAIRKSRVKAMKPETKKIADQKKFAWRLTHALARKWSARISDSSDIFSDAADVYQNIQKILSFLPDHVAIAVPDLNAAIAAFQKLGFFLERRETVASEKIETAFLNAGGFHIELLQATSPDSPISKFVEERGGGIHHVAFEVDHIGQMEKMFSEIGVPTLGGVRTGSRGKQILFLHPKSTCRALLEFCSCPMHPAK